MKYLYYILIFIFYTSCHNNTKTSDHVTELYIVLNDKKVKASDFIEKMEITMLETNDDCLISRASKVKYINEKIYILDGILNKIFIFNKDGSCDTILSKRGIGPGEYLQLLDFNVTDNELQVMDHAKAILKYDFSLKNINVEKFNSLSSRFICKNDTVFLWNEAMGSEVNYYITSINSKNNKARRYLMMPFSKNINEFPDPRMNTLIMKNDKLYASPSFSNDIYYFSNDDFNPIYKIKFNKNNFPEDKNIHEYLRQQHYIDLPYALKYNYYISDKYLIFDYYYNKRIHYCFYDMISLQLSNGIVINDYVEDFRFTPHWGNDNFLIDIVNAEHIIKYFSSLSIVNNNLKNIKEDDNPVVIIYTLKSN